MERQELIEKKAQRLRETLGFDENVTKISYAELKNSFISRYKNILIKEDLNNEENSVESAVTVTDDKFVLHVNKSNSSNKKVSLLMAIYYLDDFCSKTTETEAPMQFAVSFLIPELLLLRKVVKEEPGFEELSEDFDLSKDIIISRFETLGII